MASEKFPSADTQLGFPISGVQRGMVRMRAVVTDPSLGTRATMDWVRQTYAPRERLHFSRLEEEEGRREGVGKTSRVAHAKRRLFPI